MIGLGVDKDMILEALSYIDVFAPCREGFYDLCETTDIDKAKDYIRQYFKGTLLVTLGAEGSVSFDENDNKIAVPIQKTKVIDTTGAGDSYLGAFIYKYFVDEDSLQGAMEFATKCASFTCTYLGARACPTLAEIN
jgi:sugar/nucleoside kinase (ribokinase family)